MTDQTEGTGAVVAAPADCGRSEGALDEALVAVDLRGKEQRELAHVSELAGDEGLAECRQAFLVIVIGHHHRTVGAAEGQVDVTGVALALVVLGHEGQRHVFL